MNQIYKAELLQSKACTGVKCYFLYICVYLHCEMEWSRFPGRRGGGVRTRSFTYRVKFAHATRQWSKGRWLIGFRRLFDSIRRIHTQLRIISSNSQTVMTERPGVLRSHFAPTQINIQPRKYTRTRAVTSTHVLSHIPPLWTKSKPDLGLSSI